MKAIMLFVLLIFCSLGQAQERFFERTIKKGRETGGLYKVEIKDGSVVKRSILTKYANEYILRNIETQVVNRFGDKYEGVKSFEFLPIGEIFQYVYDNRLTPELSNYQSNFREAITKGKKASLYFFDVQNNTFNLYKDFYWNGEVTNGFVNGNGVGIYYNEYNNIAFGVKGNFSKGILNGNGTFVSYRFNGIDLFDSGKIITQVITLGEFKEGMAILTIDDKKGFVDEGMLIKINPQFRNVLQSFTQGRAVVLNENNEEIFIDKGGSFIDYTPRQNQIFEEQKKAEEARQRAVIENEIRTDYIEAINSGQEKRLLSFFRKYADSEYDFAKKYAALSLQKTKELGLAYEVPFKEAVNYEFGNRLVKIIISSKDGLPVATEAESLRDFLDNQWIENETDTNSVQNLVGNIRLFNALNQPVSFLDKAVINGEWNNSLAVDSDDITAIPSGFETFRRGIENFASNNGVTIQYLGYWGGLKKDSVAYQSEKDKVANLLKSHCTRAEIESAENPGSGISTSSTGQIKMKSGEVYTWAFDGVSFSMRVSWMEGKFSTFDELVAAFQAACQERFCG